MGFVRDGIQAWRQAAVVPSRLRREMRLVRGSTIFDGPWYLATNPDVAASGMDPAEHFCRFGAFEGRDPGPLFNLPRYLRLRPDVEADRINALVHYLDHGAAEGMVVSNLFDSGWYLSQYPEVAEAGANPLEHYIEHGASLGYDPGPDFSNALYLEREPSLLESGENALAHYLTRGVSGDISCVSATAERDAVARERAQLAAHTFFRRFGLYFSTTEAGDRPKLQQAVDYLASLKPALVVSGGKPEVSIVVPAYGQLHYLLSLLESLAFHRTERRCEIVVVDDASPASACMLLLEKIPWIRFERNTENLGFLRNCNGIAPECQGEYLVFLNTDTRVITGWLDELIGTFENFPRAGVAGSKLLFDDLRLQDAGGVFFDDGSIILYGRGDDPDDPLYSFARQADYVSGASLAVRKEVWNRLGGFDESYAPAYCEDADLAFRAREAGFEVWYQPASQIIHYEGVTHGRSILSGVKAYQAINLEKFRQRWRHVLAGYGARTPGGCAGAMRYSPAPILVLDVFTPTPDRDAGSFLAMAMIRAYVELGWHVVFAPVGYAYVPGYTRDLQRLGVECLYGPRFQSLADVQTHIPDLDYVLAFRVSGLSPVYDDIRRCWPNARLVYNTVDLHHRREARQASLMNDADMLARSELTRKRELALAVACDCTIYLSENEREVVAEACGRDVHRNSIVFPYFMDIPATSDGTEKRKHVVFLGGFGHPPNIDAAIQLTQEIWPLLRNALPETSKLLIVGADPPEEVTTLAEDRVEVTGFVPDLLPVFESARVCVAPIRYGAGIKGKVIHALAHGVPGVVTPVAAEGMGLADGRQVFIADDPGSFSQRVLQLFADDALWTNMRREGIAFVEENYSWSSCLARCTEALEVADRTWKHRQAASDGNLVPLDLG
ncbi:glycosyltransferase [Parvibaculum sp.]|uniref:glycosyltransferase n=1 Tax=Parvibaculum sp. TaxID=2024848 RepID=UPI001B07B3EA|nr:glycosyltransferase [Parvibaculum sp.]MBO6635605.1 glycosyltransferase [Parvibaculum sp.]MBO6678733.1 glycosyltransferase [Parvibaculum sp.]MBO6685364.1 glycosyltransferase [Parvibaculum sp.]MBO6905365.1 glycosyltransferase [Parvibaculum sp.]